jgi:RNA 2',3'-cyclic 3'-phosphodiesterase
MMRTFLALEMNQDQQRRLEEVIRQVARLLPGLRFVDAHGIHLTLAFLGELDDERLAQAKEATARAAQRSQPFSYRLGRIGIFGTLHVPRVIWVGIEEPTGVLVRLHQALNRELELRGFAIDKRPFSPHLTLARIKYPLSLAEQQGLQDLLVAGKQVGMVSSVSYPMEVLNVMRSDLQHDGARYTVMSGYALQG